MTTLRSEYPVARRPHRCMPCGGLIPAGDRYHRWAGTCDSCPAVHSMAECSSCCEGRGRPIPAPETRTEASA